MGVRSKYICNVLVEMNVYSRNIFLINLVLLNILKMDKDVN